MKHKYKLGAKVLFGSIAKKHWVPAIIIRVKNKTLYPIVYNYPPIGEYAIMEGDIVHTDKMRKWANSDMLRSRDET
jgi:hypothetical protein